MASRRPAAVGHHHRVHRGQQRVCSPVLVNKSARRFRGRARGGVFRRFLGLVGTFLWGALAAVPCMAQPSPPGDSPPEWTLLPRERQLQRAIDVAGDRLTSQPAMALHALQIVLSHPFDTWIREETAGQPAAYRSAKQAARRLWEQLPAVTRDAHERLLQADLQGRWRLLPTPKPLKEVWNLWRAGEQTAQGYQAAELLLARWVDEMAWHLAAPLARRVLRSPVHGSRLSPGFRERAKLALRMAGMDTAETSASAASNHAVQLDDLPVAHKPTLPGWRDLLPLPQPLWERPLPSLDMFPQITEMYREWAAIRRDRDQCPAVGWQPLVCDRWVLCRDLMEVCAFEIHTGTVAWRFPLHTGRQVLVSRGTNNKTSRPLQYEARELLLASSYAGTMSTDGSRVYVLEEAPALWQTTVSASEEEEEETTPTTVGLLALWLRAGTGESRVAWRTTQPGHPLSQAAVLGPPLVTGSVVYCLVEHDREISLAALEAERGELIWQQPLAVAERPLARDRDRKLRAASPVLHQGVVLCPTMVGLLVAVDALTGDLLWYHSGWEQLVARGAHRLPQLIPPHRRTSNLVGSVLASSQRILHLPSQSEGLFCLEAATGKLLWRIVAHEADVLVGSNQRLAVLAGGREIRAIALETGEVLWQLRLPSVMSGQPVWLSDAVLLPLDSGEVVAVELESGEVHGHLPASSRRPFGHLTWDKGRLISIHGDQVATFVTTGGVEELASGTSSLPTGWIPSSAYLKAQTAWLHGEWSSARRWLEEATHDTRPSEHEREQMMEWLRETYFRLLDAQPQQAEQWFTRLEQLCRNDDQRSRRWVAMAQWALTNHDYPLAVDAAWHTVRFDSPLLFTPPNQPGALEHQPAVWQVQLSAWLPLFEKLAPKADSLTQRWQQLQLKGSAGTTWHPRVVERLWPDDRISGEARLAWGRQAAAEGRGHVAELCYLRNLSPQQPSAIQAESAWQLMLLYHRAGLWEAAAQTLDWNWKHHPRELLSQGLTVQEAVDRNLRDSLTGQIWLRRQPLPADCVRAICRWEPRIPATSPHSYEGGTTFPGREGGFGLYGEFQRRLLALPPDYPWEWLLHQGQFAPSLVVVDRSTARPLQRYVLPHNVTWPRRENPMTVGTAQYLSLPGEVRCYSLLTAGEPTSAWETELRGRSAGGSLPLLGPMTSTGLPVQMRNELWMLDPTDGRPLWVRRDLEAGAGLASEPNIGLLLDERRVFVLGSDRQHYRLLDAFTGELLRQGRLEYDLRFLRWGVGLLIQHLAESTSGRRVRVWDAASGRVLLDEPLRERNLIAQVPVTRDLAWITPTGQLKIFDVALREITVSCECDPQELENVTGLRVMKQHDCYIVNLARNIPLVRTEQIHESPRDQLLELQPMRDEVLVVTPGRNRPLWKGLWPQGSVVNWGRWPVPVLVVVRSIKPRFHQRRWLEVEIYALKTGERLGRSEPLDETRLYHAELDSVQRQLRLIGESGDVVIELKFAAANEPLLTLQK
ncbi:MAG: hypothetical protein KatS3mg113_0085 [Planctomycetaceae bacterium]|nr:MAG: hypothetical protein KatS3mg113_0085 [Planctomycetaceae bacterium]